MSSPKVLYIVHNHPEIRSGGVEVYSQELFQAMRARPDFSACLLAKGGAPFSAAQRPHEGTMISTVSPADDGQYLFHNEGGDYDHFLGTSCAKEHLVTYLDRFLTAVRPDVVHFHHTLYLGYDTLRQVRNSLPAAAIVYSLHDYLPICHRNGQLLRTNNRERCHEPSPRRCHECFPAIAPREFFLRERFIKAQLEHVDLFLAPSEFLRERYIAWGLPREKIICEPYGRAVISARPGAASPDGSRWRFGFFGQMSLFKGVHVLLDAMKIIERLQPGAAHLWLHGNNLDLQPPEFQATVDALLTDTAASVTNSGPFQRKELRRLMENIDWVVVPSLWWENAPLVIQEAVMCGRPVICSDVGGMAEAVTSNENGLHFRVGDAMSLAETMRRAATTPGLWDRLRQQRPPGYPVAQQAEKLTGLYRQLIAQRRALS